MDKMDRAGGIIALILVVLAFVVERFNKWSDGRERDRLEQGARDARIGEARARADADRAVVDRDLAVQRARPWRERLRSALGRATRRVPR